MATTFLPYSTRLHGLMVRVYGELMDETRERADTVRGEV